LVAVGAGWWLALAPLVDAVRPTPQRLAVRVEAALDGPLAASASERARNPEWMLMADLFSVLAWSNAALDEPERAPELLTRIDAAIEATVKLETERGQLALLLPYARRAPFRDPQGRSLFVDGEIAMMLAARLSVAPDPAYAEALRQRVALIEASLGRGPVLSGESYPDECWTFCNTTALAALVLADRVLGCNHRPLVDAWLDEAKTSLIDPQTGLLVSSYTWDGEVLDGPEGSSIFMVAHNLLLLDPDFARDQYARAHAQLGRSFAGFGWSREWPSGTPDRVDVDSGLVVPVLGASPGASGLALLGATTFGDTVTRDRLLRSMELAAVPARTERAHWYRAAGRIGNAVAAYALHFGPLWARARGAA
jgi:hypothetical protein